LQNQPHPIAKAVPEWLANQESLKTAPLKLEVENVLGQGMKATDQGFGWCGGSKAFVVEHGGDLKQKQEALSRLTGKTLFYVTPGRSLNA
jgi:cation transport ATPase